MTFVEQPRFAPFVRRPLRAASIAAVAAGPVLAALLAGCSGGGKLPGPFSCSGDGTGGYCELGNGAYLGFRLGMTKQQAYSNLCGGGHGGVITTIDFYNSREDMVGYEFTNDHGKMICSTPRAQAYNYWTLASVGALPGQDNCTKVGTRYVYMDFMDGRLARVATTCQPVSPEENVFHPDSAAPKTTAPTNEPMISHSGPDAAQH